MMKIRYEVSQLAKLGTLFTDTDQKKALQVAKEVARKIGETVCFRKIAILDGVYSDANSGTVLVRPNGTWSRIN